MSPLSSTFCASKCERSRYGVATACNTASSFARIAPCRNASAGCSAERRVERQAPRPRPTSPARSGRATPRSRGRLPAAPRTIHRARRATARIRSAHRWARCANARREAMSVLAPANSELSRNRRRESGFCIVVPRAQRRMNSGRRQQQRQRLRAALGARYRFAPSRRSACRPTTAARARAHCAHRPCAAPPRRPRRCA